MSLYTKTIVNSSPTAKKSVCCCLKIKRKFSFNGNRPERFTGKILLKWINVINICHFVVIVVVVIIFIARGGILEGVPYKKIKQRSHNYTVKLLEMCKHVCVCVCI